MGSLFKPLKNRLMTVCIIFMILITFLFMRFVDLRPEVSPDFFFGSNDPELAQSAAIHDLFPSDEFLMFSAGARDIFSPRYYDRLLSFSEDLAKIAGISRVVSVATGPENVKAASKSPFWRPLLISDDNSATLIIAFIDPNASPDLIMEVEAASALFSDGEAFDIRISGMPYIVEQIRRSLIYDLKTFSTASLVIFAIILLMVFRSPVIALGACASGITAIFLTLLILQGLGQSIGILTANLAIIVFVLVQSQVIYLTANWRQLGESEGVGAVRRAVFQTFRASFWCMVTTLLGFATLVSVAAEPLRQLGTGGVVGAIVALLSCYLLYPVFLLFAVRRQPEVKVSRDAGNKKLARGFQYGVGFCLILIALATVPGLFRLNTDPSLLSYFEEGSDLHEGLAFVDRNGGSSPLKLVVRLKEGGRLDTESGYEAMWRLHNDLLAEKNVGTVISLPALLAEANSHPLAFLLPWREIVSLLSLGINDNVVNSFLNEDRDQVLYLLRMKETSRVEPRNEVTERLQGIVTAAGFETTLVGGVYMLQGRLSDLVTRSLLTGISMLLLLFGMIAWMVSRNWRIAAAMTVTAALIPVTLLGSASLFGIPVDIISAPAVSVCLGIAVDALIHLALALRRNGYPAKVEAAIDNALRDQYLGIVTSSGIIAIGFMIFSISAFPPTARFGGEIVLGALFAGVAALTLFPMLARLFVTSLRSA